MEPLNGIDVAIGWALIIAVALICYYGIPFLIAAAVRNIRSSSERSRLERERLQEDLDECARQHLLSVLTSERHKDEKAD